MSSKVFERQQLKSIGTFTEKNLCQIRQIFGLPGLQDQRTNDQLRIGFVGTQSDV